MAEANPGLSVPADRFTETPWLRLTPQQRFLAGAVLALANFMVVLDLTIANVSVPHIAGNLGVSIDQGTWVITSYAVAEAICVPLRGWLAQRFGTVRLFLFAMLGFGLFSLACGLSVSLGMLVVCRLGQGLCGGPIMPMSQTLLVRVFPPKQRAMAMGIWAMTSSLGPACGPIVGGFLNDDLSWHWIFFINVPIAVVSFVMGVRFLRSVETERRTLPIDKIGLALLVFLIVCLQLMLDTGRDLDWVSSPRIVILAVLAVLGLAVFVIWEVTEEHPVVNLRLFRYRAFSTSCIILSLSFGSYFAGIVVVPQWLQTTMGYTATKAGAITALSSIASLSCAQIVTRLLPRMDPRVLICFGTLWMAAMSFMRAGWTSGANFAALAWPMALLGVGVPFLFIPLSTMSLSSVKPQETTSASGLSTFARSMAIALATSAVLTIWDNSQIAARSDLVGRLHTGALQSQLSAAGLAPLQGLQTISTLVDVQATTLALNHTFLVAAILLVGCSVLTWTIPRIPLIRLTGGEGHH